MVDVGVVAERVSRLGDVGGWGVGMGSASVAGACVTADGWASWVGKGEGSSRLGGVREVAGWGWNRGAQMFRVVSQVVGGSVVRGGVGGGRGAGVYGGGEL